MELAYAQVELIVADMQNVHEKRLGALESKFKRFRRMGFPPGVNAGQGRHFKYDLEHTLLVVLAFSLLRSLMLPEGVVALLERHKALILGAAKAVAGEQGLLGGSRRERSASTACLLLIPKANALWTVPKPEDAAATGSYRPELPADLEVSSLGELSKIFSDPDKPLQSAIVIDLYGIVEEVTGILLRTRWIDNEALRSAFESLSGQLG